MRFQSKTIQTVAAVSRTCTASLSDLHSSVGLQANSNEVKAVDIQIRIGASFGPEEESF